MDFSLKIQTPVIMDKHRKEENSQGADETPEQAELVQML